MEVLRIYTRVAPVTPLGVAARCWAAAVAASCAGILTIAAWLQPSAAGFGTHTQLGLTSCAFFDRTGIPCPACGMTTAFAHTVRGHFLSAAYTQPMGFILALVAAIVFWVAAYEAVTARPVHRLLRVVAGDGIRLVWLGAVLALIGWAWKIAIVMKFGGLGPTL